MTNQIQDKRNEIKDNAVKGLRAALKDKLALKINDKVLDNNI